MLQIGNKYKNSLYIFCNSSEMLKLFQNERFLKNPTVHYPTIKNKQNEKKKTLVVSSTLRWFGNQLKDLEKDICPLSVPHPYPKAKSNPGGCGQFLQRHQPPGPDCISRAPGLGTVR